MDEERFEEIKYQMEYRSTEELQKILKDRNYDEWTEEAFEAIKRIIDERKVKKKVTEMEAAALFVMTILKDSQKKWPSIAKELNQLLIPKKKFSKKQSDAMEFSFAVIAQHIQALPNLLEQEQAKRILEYIMKIISTPELGTYPREIIKKYQDEWDACLEQAEPPFYGIASVLFDALGCKDTQKMGDDYYIKSPIVLMALAEQVTKFGNPRWWKNLTERYNIVKDDLPGVDF